jgi:hypothetical protein
VFSLKRLQEAATSTPWVSFLEVVTFECDRKMILLTLSPAKEAQPFRAPPFPFA